MSTQVQLAPVLELKPRWSFASRAAFRFCVVYFGLFCLLTQILGSLIAYPDVEIPDPSGLWPVRQTVFWTARHIFGVTQTVAYNGSGSGDKTFDWVLVFCMLVAAALAAGIWSIRDRKRESYPAAYKWFRLVMRFALASQMLTYGMAKAIPSQMPFPLLNWLVEPFGNFSPMRVLWSSIGASPAYETFAGCAELLGGVLLIVPRTTMLGALICLADMVEVFTLNMTYDVPVKLFSFHLIVMALLLLAPDLRRLADFLLGRGVAPAAEPKLFGVRRANRIAVAAQVIFGIWLLGMNAYGGWTNWHKYGGGSPKPPLYGIWNVDQFTSDGQLRPALMTDGGRWRRVIFETPRWMSFQ